MVSGDIIREQRLNVNNDASPILQRSDTFIKDAEQYLEVGIPRKSIFRLVVIQSKVVGRRGKDEIDAIVRQCLEHYMRIATDDFMYEF